MRAAAIRIRTLRLAPIHKTGIIALCALTIWLAFIGIGMWAARVAADLLLVLQ